jgi:hypothetical protein
MTRPIDRKNLRKCIACGCYHPLDNLVGQTFRAGKHRFHVCIPCWREDSTPRYCPSCGDTLTALNTDLKKQKRGGYRVDRMRCMTCTNKLDILQARVKHFRRTLPHILKSEE